MARYAKSRSQQILTLIALLAIAILKWWSGGWDSSGDGRADRPGSRQSSNSSQPNPPRGSATGSSAERESVRVERVVDGDTLLLGPNGTRARMQGIDTPETVKEDTPVQPWGPEATQYTKKFVHDAGNRVEIEVDGEYQDQYGRRLVFVWSGERLLNEELVRQGLARPKLAYDYSQAKKDLLKRAQREAQTAKRGLWSGASGSVSP